MPAAAEPVVAPNEQEHRLSDGGMRRFPSHERLDSMYATVGGMLKGKGGKPKAFSKEDLQAVEAKPLSSRMLVTSMLVLVFCLLLNQVGLFVPLVIMARNCALSKVPLPVQSMYPVCSDQMLANEMTIVVTVKDTCSQVAAARTPRPLCARALRSQPGPGRPALIACQAAPRARPQPRRSPAAVRSCPGSSRRSSASRRRAST